MPTAKGALDASFWVAVAAAAASTLSLVIAWSATRTSRKALHLAEQQEEHRRLTLVPYLADGFCKYEEPARLLAFSVSLSNPADYDNGIARLELQLDYQTNTGAAMMVKLPTSAGIASRFAVDTLRVLTPPVRVDAHQAVAGWLCFEVPAAIVGDSSIQNYTLLFEDTKGLVTRLEHLFPRDLVDASALSRI